MRFDYPILAEHAWAAIRDDGRLQNSRFFFFINFGFKRSSRASQVLPSLALRFIVYGRKKT